MGLGGIHPIQLLIVLALVLILFGGRGRISALMGDMARGIRSFRKGLKDSEEEGQRVAERAETPEQVDRS